MVTVTHAPWRRPAVDSVADDAAAGATPPPAGRFAAWRRAALVVWLVASWLVVATLTWCAASVWLGFTTVAPITGLLQSLVPIVFLPVWIVGAVAFVLKRFPLGGACVALALVHVVLVWPTIGSHSTPRWAASAPKVTLLAINMFDRNESPDAAAARVLASHADVLALVEVSTRQHAALVRAGIDQRFPYQEIALPSPNGETDGIYSRRPFTSERQLPVVHNYLPSVQLDVGGRSLQIVAVHIDGALHGATQWADELAGIRPIARGAHGPLVIAGDFNATRWNPPFRDLLGDHLSDAHEAKGQGLSRSWPVLGTKLAIFGPLMRLDHALVNGQVAVESVHDVRVPGSDHVGFELALAIGG